MNFKFKSIKDALTGIDGSTIDGLKLVGYPSFIVAFLVFLIITVKNAVTSNTFDPVSFGLGFSGLVASLGIIAAGVAIKSHTEPPATTTDVPPTAQ
jgi:hypothetical protein